MPQLLDELRQEHKSIAKVLGCLDRQIRIFETGGHPDFGIIAAVLDYFEGFPDQYHHPKEDLLLARLSERDQTLARVVGDLAQSHVELGDNLRTFATAVRAVLLDAELPRDAFVGRARAFIDSQRGHLAMEEASFFPAAERALTADDWSELGASVPRVLDPLHGGEDESKYESLRRNILAWDAEDRWPDESYKPPGLSSVSTHRKDSTS
ncbi:MAG: hemerythrin domain-containing protein [Methylocella sp.]